MEEVGYHRLFLHVVRALYVRLKAYKWLARTARTLISYVGPLMLGLFGWLRKPQKANNILLQGGTAS